MQGGAGQPTGLSALSGIYKLLANRQTAQKGSIADTWIDYIDIDCDDTRRNISLSYTPLWPSRLRRSGHAMTGGRCKGPLSRYCRGTVSIPLQYCHGTVSVLSHYKYILQFETNSFCNLRQIYFAIEDKLILQFETNTFLNWRQIHFAT